MYGLMGLAFLGAAIGSSRRKSSDPRIAYQLTDKFAKHVQAGVWAAKSGACTAARHHQEEAWDDARAIVDRLPNMEDALHQKLKMLDDAIDDCEHESGSWHPDR